MTNLQDFVYRPRFLTATFRELASFLAQGDSLRLRNSTLLASMWSWFKVQNQFCIDAQHSRTTYVVSSAGGTHVVFETRCLKIVGSLSEFKSLILNLRKLTSGKFGVRY